MAPLGSISCIYPAVLWLDNRMIIKACSRNINSEATISVHKQKNQTKGSGQVFLSKSTFVPRKVDKMFLLSEDVVLPPFF